MHKAFKPGRTKGRIGHTCKDEHLMKHHRGSVSKMIRLYRKRFRVLTEAGLIIDFQGKTIADHINHNNKIDAVLNAAGLGDIREDRWEKLQ